MVSRDSYLLEIWNPLYLNQLNSMTVANKASLPAANLLSRMEHAVTRDRSRLDYRGLPTRTRSDYSSHETQMAFQSMLPIAKQLKEESGTRFSVKYLIKVYQTPQALERKLTWVRGCKASVG